MMDDFKLSISIPPELEDKLNRFCHDRNELPAVAVEKLLWFILQFLNY